MWTEYFSRWEELLNYRKNKAYHIESNTDPITHAYVHRLADVLLAGFAPAFTLSLPRQRMLPQTASAHSLGRYQQAEKKKDRVRHRLADLNYTFALI